MLVRLLKWTFVLVTVSLWGLKPDWCWWLFVECLAGSDNKLISGSLDIISTHNLWRLYHSPLCPTSPLTTDKGRNAKWLNIWICSSSKIFWRGSISHPGSEGGSGDDGQWEAGDDVCCGDQWHHVTGALVTNNVKINGHTHTGIPHTSSNQGIFRLLEELSVSEKLWARWNIAFLVYQFMRLECLRWGVKSKHLPSHQTLGGCPPLLERFLYYFIF